MPATAARRRLLRRLIETASVSNQTQIAEAFEAEGHRVSQATISRDLDAVGAVKDRDPQGDAVYRLAGPPTVDSDVRAVLETFVLDVVVSGQLVVVKTPPAAAHLVGSAVDGASIPGVAGTVAGDDTLLVVATEEEGGEKVADRLRGDDR